jgi:eukaryotic-like serine/threonine-protein kinase
MMTRSPLCGDSQWLRELLDDRLPRDRQEELMEHLESCESCRAAFDRLAGESNWWSDLRRYIRPETATESSIPPTVTINGARRTPPGANSPIPRDDDAPALNFLGPPMGPGQLGCFGPYEVLELIGQGGMGIVLKAFDPALRRLVAIKILAPQLATVSSARRRFIREARAAASVVHDHVVTIHAVDEASGLPYLVMQYVQGVSLQQRLDRDGSLAVKEILRIGMQAAQGLAAAHAQGLVHRDIKPANILLENGVERVKITDFGLARAADDASETQSGVVAGTPQFMAPEQAKGEAIDHRADLFSLGSVLYTMATGRPPFRAESTFAILKRVCEDVPRPIREINAEIPEWLAAIIARLHAKKPDERIQSALELADLLAHHLANVQKTGETPARQASSSEVGVAKRRPHKRSRALRVAAVTALLLLTGLGLSDATGVTRVSSYLATVLRIAVRDGILVVEVDDPEVIVQIDGDAIAIVGAGAKEIRLNAGRHQVRATRGGVLLLTELVTITRGGRQVVKIGMETASVERTDNDRQPRLEAKKGVANTAAGGPAPIENAKASSEITAIRSFAAHERAAKSVAFSPDGRRSLSGSGYPDGDRSMRLWDVATGRELRQFTGETGQVLSVSFSPDGRHALSGGEDPGVRLWDVETGRELRVFQGHPAAVNSVVFTPDGRRALSGGMGDGIIRLWDVETGEEIRRFEGHTASVYSAACSPDGKYVLSGGEDRTVRLWEIESGRQVRQLAGPARFVESVAFSPDSRRAMAGGYDAVAWVWDVASGRELARFNGAKGMIACVTFTPDGRHALSVVGPSRGETGSSGALSLWEVETGRMLACATPEGATGLWSVAVSPDGREALTGGADGHLRLWRLPAFGSPARPVVRDFVGYVRQFVGHTDWPEAVVLAQHGRRALSGGKDRTVRLWDVETGLELRRFDGHEDAVADVAVTADGRLAASASLDRTVRLWDVETGRELRQLKGHERKVRAVALSPDGRLVLSGSEENELRLWDTSTGKEKRRFQGHSKGICSVTFSPDGRRALSGSVDGTARLWDVETGTEIRTLCRGEVWGTALAFFPDGRRVLTGLADGAFSLWDVDTGGELRRFPSLGGSVRSVACSPDSRVILAAGSNFLRLYDVKREGSLYALRGVGGGIVCAALLPDSRHVLFGCYNATLQLWRLPMGPIAERSTGTNQMREKPVTVSDP